MAYQPIAPQQQEQQEQQPYQQPIPSQYGSTANAQVVTVQPAATGTVHIYKKKVNANGALILSVIVAIALGLISPVTLCCSVPAVIIAIMAMDGPNLEERASKVRISFILSIIALTFGLVVTTLAVIFLLMVIIRGLILL